MEEITGVVERITFHSPDTGYTVARVQTPRAKELRLFRHRYGKEIPSRRIWRGKGMLARREELCMKEID